MSWPLLLLLWLLLAGQLLAMAQQLAEARDRHPSATGPDLGGTPPTFVPTARPPGWGVWLRARAKIAARKL